MIEAVIFDWDGTAADTESIHDLKEIRFSNKYGYKHNLSLKQELMGMSSRDGAEFLRNRFNISAEVDVLEEERRKLYESFYFDAFREMPGFSKIVLELRKVGFLLGIATSSEPQYVKHGLDKLGLFDKFVTIVYGKDVLNGKPFPDIYFETARRLKVDPSLCVAIEDSVNGVTAAKKAGMICFAVCDARYSNPHCFKPLANLVCSSLNEIDVGNLSR